MARAARIPWRFYVACALLAALAGLLAQWAIPRSATLAQASQSASAVDGPLATPTALTTDVSTAAPGVAGQTVCGSGDEPSYGLVDPCLPARSPLE